MFEPKGSGQLALLTSALETLSTEPGYRGEPELVSPPPLLPVDRPKVLGSVRRSGPRPAHRLQCAAPTLQEWPELGLPGCHWIPLLRASRPLDSPLFQDRWHRRNLLRKDG